MSGALRLGLVTVLAPACDVEIHPARVLYTSTLDRDNVSDGPVLSRPHGEAQQSDKE
jgi:hypothetical protein